MPNILADMLTAASANTLDFYNSAGLLTERTRDGLSGLWTHYSWREYFIRGGIIAAAAVTAYYAANTCKTDDCSTVQRGLIGFGLGFFAAHTPVVIPKMLSRRKIQTDTNEVYEQTAVKLEQLRELGKQLPEHTSELSKLILQMDLVSSQSYNLKLPLLKKGDLVTNLMTVKKLVRTVDRGIADFISDLKRTESHKIAEFLSLTLTRWNQPYEQLCQQLTKNEALFLKGQIHTI